VRFQTKPESCA